MISVKEGKELESKWIWIAESSNNFDPYALLLS